MNNSTQNPLFTQTTICKATFTTLASKVLLATSLFVTSNLALANNQPSVGQMNRLLDSCFLQSQQAQQKELIEKTNTVACNAILRSNWLSRDSESNVRLNRGIIFMAKGQTKKAIRDFKRVVKIKPASYQAHIALAQIFNTERDYAQAKHHYDQAIAINNTNPKVLHNHELVAKSIAAEKQERLSMR